MYRVKLKYSNIFLEDEKNIPLELKLREDDYIDNSSALIEFSIDIEEREFGIKSISLYVDKVVLTITILRSDSIEEVEDEIDFDLSDYEVKEEKQDRGTGDTSYTIRELQVNFEKKELTIIT